MSDHRQPPAALDWGLLALLGVIWGGAFLGVELALDSLSPIWVATGRIALAALLLLGIALHVSGRQWSLNSVQARYSIC